MKLFQRKAAWRRLFRIYLELGYIPWQKPKKVRKRDEGVHMGTREAIIPFLNKDAKRTITDLVFRPGYLMRDYIQRGKHEQFLAPFTALLVFYSVFTLLTAIVQPGASRNAFGDSLLEATKDAQVEVPSDIELGKVSISKEKTELLFTRLFHTVTNAILITHLDLYPEAVDTPWKTSLAAVESDLLLLRKYDVHASGAAAASAYVLCQFCIYMFLALLISFGKSSELGLLIMGLLLFIDYRQWLQVGNKKALGLTIKTGLIFLVALGLYYVLLGTVLVILAVYGIT